MYIVFSLESKLNNVKINLDFEILEMFLEKQEHNSKKIHKILRSTEDVWTIAEYIWVLVE